jgi:hypothetical protein
MGFFRQMKLIGKSVMGRNVEIEVSSRCNTIPDWSLVSSEGKALPR